MNRQDFKYFRRQLKHGYRITLMYSKIASTGEVATTHSSFKTFKYDVKRLAKENIDFSVRVESPIRDVIARISSVAEKLKQRGYKTLSKELEQCTLDLIIYS